MTPKPTPAPFKIDSPGLYLTRDGRTVEIERRARKTDCYGPEWVWYGRTPGRPSYGNAWRRDGYSISTEYPTPIDLVAKAPAPPAPKPRPAKGKKAKRRYRVTPGSNLGVFLVHDDEERAHIATLSTRADARAFAAMKEAQRGGA